MEGIFKILRCVHISKWICQKLFGNNWKQHASSFSQLNFDLLLECQALVHLNIDNSIIPNERGMTDIYGRKQQTSHMRATTGREVEQTQLACFLVLIN